MTLKEFKEKSTGYTGDQYGDNKTLIIVAILSFFLTILIGIVLFGYFLKITAIDGAVIIEEREVRPLGFDLAALFIIVIIIIYIVVRINREES